MIADIFVNLVLLVADAAILLVLWKKREPKVFAILLVVCGFAAPFFGFASLFLIGLFASTRVCAWAIFVHGVIVLGGGAALLWKLHRKTAITAAVTATLIALVGVDAFFIEPHWLEVTRYRIVSARVKRPLKIAIIADIQTDEIGAYERRVLEVMSDEKPDLILLAGDYIQEHDDALRKELIRKLSQALARAPYAGTRDAVAVEGNCDSPDWTEPLEGNGITCARVTQTIEKSGIQITALSMDDSFDSTLRVEPRKGFHIALGHAPDFALGDVKADLLVAGHTHGGQVRLPFIGPLITLSSVPRSWAAGKTELAGGRTLIVSRGIGMERGRAPRLRFLCRPELVIVDVVPAQ